MRRALVAAAALVSCLAAPAPAAPYAGEIREASATFRLRGVDGHAITLAFTVRSSGAGGTTSLREAELVVTDCARSRCAPAKRYFSKPDEADYAESFDLSVTVLATRVGNLVLMVGWSSDAGWGRLPPAPVTAGGAAVTAERGATAVLLAGPVLKGDQFAPVARCTDGKAKVRSSFGAWTGERPTGSWPSVPPPGLRVKPLASRVFTCR